MRKHASAQATISANAHKTLLNDVYQRRHIEACGMLTGSIDDCENWHVEQVHPLRNTSDSPIYFEFAPEDLLAVDLDYPGQVVGVYHSHPTGMAVASSTDRENMRRINVEQQIPWVWLIVSGPFNGDCTLLPSEQVASPPIIAYHHYEDEGLRRITIAFEDSTEGTPCDAQQ